MKDTTPQAEQAAHELRLWLIPQIDKAPRIRRFTLGERIEGTGQPRTACLRLYSTRSEHPQEVGAVRPVRSNTFKSTRENIL